MAHGSRCRKGGGSSGPVGVKSGGTHLGGRSAVRCAQKKMKWMSGGGGSQKGSCTELTHCGEAAERKQPEKEKVKANEGWQATPDAAAGTYGNLQSKKCTEVCGYLNLVGGVPNRCGGWGWA